MRSKEFNEDIVLEKIMKVFLQNGYKKTSMSSILEVTGLHKGNLYRTFGSKENMFKLSIQKYSNTFHQYNEQQDPLEYIQTFFKGKIKSGLSHDRQFGCLIMNSCVEFGDDDSELSKSSICSMDMIEDSLKMAIRKLKDEKRIEKHFTVERLTNQMLGAIFAMVEMAKFKKSESLLKDIANNAIKDLKIKV